MLLPRTHAIARLLVLVVALFAVLGSQRAFAYECEDGAEHVRTEQLNDSTFVWHIDCPNVRQHETQYEQIGFRDKDEVWVTATGCVQTGGVGATWKRYVDPKGKDSDRFYHGLIKIPGGTLGLVPIASVLAQHMFISTGDHRDPSAGHLTLGYEDPTDYNDNGYNNHDDGNDDQCKNTFGGGVTITIIHHTVRIPPPDRLANMDLWWHSVDDNNLPLNPTWQYFRNTGNLPLADQLCNEFTNEGDGRQFGGCTTQAPTVDEVAGPLADPIHWSVCHLRDADDTIHGNPNLGENSVHGHINWGEATYTGTLWFDDWQSGLKDHDVDLLLGRDDQAGATLANAFSPGSIDHRALCLEFMSDETVDNFVTPTWRRLTEAIHDGNRGAEIRTLLDGRKATVVGLIGIDNQHGSKAEVHPVHGLLIRLANTDGQARYLFFARNFGNEGFCSQDQHMFDGGSMYFFLDGVQSLDIGQCDVRTTTPGSSWSVNSFPDGVLLVIAFPSTGATSTVYGELAGIVAGRPAVAVHHVRRRHLAGAVTATESSANKKPTLANRVGASRPVGQKRHVRASTRHLTPGGPAEGLEVLLRQMTPGERERFVASQKPQPRGLLLRRAALQQPHVIGVRDTSLRRQAYDLDENDKRAWLVGTRGVARFDTAGARSRLEQYRALVAACGSEARAKAILEAAWKRPAVK